MAIGYLLGRISTFSSTIDPCGSTNSLSNIIMVMCNAIETINIILDFQTSEVDFGCLTRVINLHKRNFTIMSRLEATGSKKNSKKKRMKCEFFFCSYSVHLLFPWVQSFFRLGHNLFVPLSRK